MKEVFFTAYPNLVSKLSDFLALKEISQASLVCKQWKKAFSHPDVWRDRLLHDFNITPKSLAAVIPTNEPSVYKELYRRLSIFSRRKLKRHLYRFCEKNYNVSDPLFLACFLDNEDYFFKHCANYCEYFMWCMVSLYAGSQKIPQQIINSGNVRPDNSFLNTAVVSGNFQFVSWLMDSNNAFNLHPRQDTLAWASISGHISILQFFLDPKRGFHLKPDEWVLRWSAGSGNLKIVQFLLDPNNEFNLKPDRNILSSAAESGNIDLVQFLCNTFDLKPDQDALHYAARSGSFALVRFLLDKYNLKPSAALLSYAAAADVTLMQWSVDTFKLKPHRLTLAYAAQYNNRAMISFLLDRFQIKPDEYTLNYAAQGGHLDLVTWLLSPDQGFGLQPNQATLNDAALSGNTHLVQFLLRTTNKFQLKVDQEILKKAIGSENYSLVLWLLDPQREFNLVASEETIKYAHHYWGDTMQNLLLSDNMFKRGLAILKDSSVIITKTTNEVDENNTLLNSNNNNQSVNAISGIAEDSLNTLDSAIFEKAYITCPSHFYYLLEYTLTHLELMKNEIGCKEFLKLDCVLKTPLPNSQYMLANLAQEGRYLNLDSELIIKLYKQAKDGLERLGKAELAVKAQTKLEQCLVEAESFYLSKRNKLF